MIMTDRGPFEIRFDRESIGQPFPTAIQKFIKIYAIIKSNTLGFVTSVGSTPMAANHCQLLHAICCHKTSCDINTYDLTQFPLFLLHQMTTQSKIRYLRGKSQQRRKSDSSYMQLENHFNVHFFLWFYWGRKNLIGYRDVIPSVNNSTKLTLTALRSRLQSNFVQVTKICTGLYIFVEDAWDRE